MILARRFPPSQIGIVGNVNSGGNVSYKKSSLYIIIVGISSKEYVAYPPFWKLSF